MHGPLNQVPFDLETTRGPLAELGVSPSLGARAGAKGAKQPPALSATPDAFALLRSLQHRWALAVGLGALSALVAAAAAWYVVPKPKYKATSLLQVSEQIPKYIFDLKENQPNFKTYQATQLALIKSRLVLNAALRQPDVTSLESVREQADPVGWLDGAIKAELPLNSELLQISITGDRPRDLATLVNAVADAYMEQVVTKERKDRLTRYERLQKLYEDQQRALTVKRGNVRKLAETVGSDNRQNVALQQKAKIEQLSLEQKELLKVQMDLKRQRVELAVLDEAEASQSVASVTSALVEDQLEKDALIVRHRTRIAETINKIHRTERTVRDKNDPALRALRRDLEHARRQLADDRAGLRPRIAEQLQALNQGDQSGKLSDLRLEVRMNSDLEKVLEEGIERLTRESQSFNLKAMDLQSLQDEIGQKESIANQIGKEVEALGVELEAPQRIRLIERAEEPRVENAQKRRLAIALASLGMFSCAVLGVSWREYRTRRIDSAAEIVNVLGMRLVGSLPERPRSSPGVPRASREPHWESLLIESIDAARTMLLHECRVEAHRVLMITSAMKGEGKSSLAAHLAISLGRTGRRTLLIDFDLRDPSVHRLFDVPPGPGVCELLRGEVNLDEVIRPVASGLDVITAGRCDAEALRALAQDRLAQLFGRLRQGHEFIIVDSAPVLPVADSLLLSQHIDAALFSVYREVSRVPTVYAGYERLANLGTRLLGVVVTGVPPERFGEDAHCSISART